MNKLLIPFLICLSVSTAYAKPIVVIDAGHEPSKTGAIGTCQKNEVVYNDELVSFVSRALAKDYQVILTREPGKEVDVSNPALATYLPGTEAKKWSTFKSLLARPAIANKNQAAIFISIHHDSTSAKHQVYLPALCNGKGGKTLNAQFKKKYKIGYNVFVYPENKSKRELNSLKLAGLVGQQIKNIGRKSSDYHVAPDDGCKSCRPINKANGVWSADLAVLRDTTMPAILIEAGNIVDVDDEAVINNDVFRREFSLAVKRAVDGYFK